MTKLIEIVDRIIAKDAAQYAGRKYRYGSRVRIQRLDKQVDVTVIGCGEEYGDACFDYVQQNGTEFWAWNSQILEILAL